jgi:hypothetical protein
LRTLPAETGEIRVNPEFFGQSFAVCGDKRLSATGMAIRGGLPMRFGVLTSAIPRLAPRRQSFALGQQARPGDPQNTRSFTGKIGGPRDWRRAQTDLAPVICTP